MKELYRKYRDLLSLDGLEIKYVIGLVSAGLFGLVGLVTWLIGLLIGKHLKK